MLGVLFWNLRGHDLSDSVGRIAAAHHTDLVVLAESRNRHPFSAKLSSSTGKTFSVYRIPGCSYLRVLTSLRSPHITTVEADRRHAMLRIHRPPLQDLLFAFSHLPPKGPGENSASNQRNVAGDLHQRIEVQESAFGHRRTIVAGDLNMDPFETGMIDAKGLHAVSARGVAERITRIINNKPSAPMFFNPMWRYAGDPVQGPPGTYYKSCSLTDCLFWRVFDQVLVRHEAHPLFDYTSLKVLTGDGAVSFLTANGIPNKKRFSDHLPVVFSVHA